MANDKDYNLNSSRIDDDELLGVSGGKMMTEHLTFKKSTKVNKTNTLYSGEVTQKNSNLLYKDDDRVRDLPLDGPKLC